MWFVGGLVINKLPKLWIRPSRGPLWELNRQTGMVTVFDYDNNGEYKKNGTIGELTAPFHEFDAYVISSPDRQGLPLNVLHLSHRYRDIDRKSTRLNSSRVRISYAVFCLKKKKK